MSRDPPSISQQSYYPLSHLAGHSKKLIHHRDLTPTRSQTPNSFEDARMGDSATVLEEAEEDTSRTILQTFYQRAEPGVEGNASGEGSGEQDLEDVDSALADDLEDNSSVAIISKEQQPPRKAARTIDEDNYDDDDEEDEESTIEVSPLKHKSNNALLSPSKSGSSPVSDGSPTKHIEQSKDGSQEQPKSSEDARKQLEDAKKATEEAAKRSFNTLIYTLDHDRLAMQEHTKLEESEKQIDAEMHAGGTSNGNGNSAQHGTLSQANLGASSLTLKHLIARIDLKRDQVRASDAELRSLMNEVRKNRSKWASEENVGQEELYEAAEKVLSELKAMTEYSAPFLTRVNKREAPDYYNIIKHPMDFGTMTKKLKGYVYKSKAEFVADLDLIWGNCLKYNGEITHPLRRNANSMRKEAEKLVPLIPEITVRPRAEVEAEERRKQNGGDDDGAEDSDDEPIMSSRGRAANNGAMKAAAKSRTSASGPVHSSGEGTPGLDVKPTLQLNGLLNGLAREGSETGMEGSNGFSTPPVGAPGSITPLGMHGTDGMDLDVPMMNGLGLGQALLEDVHETEDFKIWKQVTKKDRALVAKERHRIFKGDKINPDEVAPLRNKAGMRRWLRQQSQTRDTSQPEDGAVGKGTTQETLAEGMEGEEERVLPDYYDILAAIPSIPKKLQWVESSEGHVLDRREECLRLAPRGIFIAPKSALTSKVEANMRQMQETRKICSKIGVIKQMQLQAQMYNNQFPKYEPEPFVEADIEPHVISDDGPIMSPWVCKSALQRSVAKLCYHAGFEELQPSALDVITDIAGDYFGKLARAFNIYREAPKVPANGVQAKGPLQWQERFTNEEIALHAFNECGTDIEALEIYIKDDIDRFSGKLGVMHERMKAHLADLLRPALKDAGHDGDGAFNDGSEQFVGGDFAEELGEDFFGFKSLGLDLEFNMSSLSVPLHLINTRIHSQYTGPVAVTSSVEIFPPLAPLEPVTKENVSGIIGLMQHFFTSKINADGVVLEDEDLPIKQRPSKPRLPPTGKITSPRKRPLKEQAGNAKKKKKLDNGVALDVSNGVKLGANESPNSKTIVAGKKLKLIPNGISMDRADSSQGNNSPTEKDDASAVGMMSPESIER